MFPTDVTADTQGPPALPRGPHRLAREVVTASQRGRLLDAMAEVVAEKGYGAATVADVIARAGVSRRTFYEQFSDREECFLAAYETGVEILLATVREAGADANDPAARMRARVRAYLETLAAEPAFARTFLIEVAAAGPRALARRAQVHERFAQLSAELLNETRAQAPGLPDVPPELHLAAVGATNELVSRHVTAGRTAELPALEEIVLRVHVSLLVG